MIVTGRNNKPQGMAFTTLRRASKLQVSSARVADSQSTATAGGDPSQLLTTNNIGNRPLKRQGFPSRATIFEISDTSQSISAF